MCWDTSWIYTHYRPVLGNRILIGGSSAWKVYNAQYSYSPSAIKGFINQLKENFPSILTTDLFANGKEHQDMIREYLERDENGENEYAPLLLE